MWKYKSKIKIVLSKISKIFSDLVCFGFGDYDCNHNIINDFLLTIMNNCKNLNSLLYIFDSEIYFDEKLSLFKNIIELKIFDCKIKDENII